MIYKKGQPISGGSGQWQATPNSRLQNHAAYTSEDAQNLVSASATPFRSSYGPAMFPAPAQPDNRAASNFSQDGLRFGARGRANSVRGMTDPNFGAVGYAPGATKPKSGNPIISGRPTRGGRQLVGEINLPKGIKGVKRFATNADIFSPRVLHEAGYSRL